VCLSAGMTLIGECMCMCVRARVCAYVLIILNFFNKFQIICNI